MSSTRNDTSRWRAFRISHWLSVSADLRFDSQRDLRDIGARNIKIHPLNKFKYAKISGKENGSVKKGCVFATYSSLIGECRTAKNKYRTRLKQLIQWCGKVILFSSYFSICIH
uniref:Strawberry notch AAA domain-containing protein n=1 Tax=Parascaris equorum TaxID=6256 RepID=A0A914RTK0_PAREQ